MLAHPTSDKLKEKITNSGNVFLICEIVRFMVVVISKRFVFKKVVAIAA